MGLETVELVMTWEETFGVRIPDDLACRLETPELATGAIMELLARDGRMLSRNEVADLVRESTLAIAGVDPADYRTDARFVADFGLD